MLEHLSANLDRAAQRHNITEEVLAVRVLEATRRFLRELLGPDADQYFTPLAFRQGELRIGVADPVAGAGLRQCERNLIEKLNATLPRARIERVRYTPQGQRTTTAR